MIVEAIEGLPVVDLDPHLTLINTVLAIAIAMTSMNLRGTLLVAATEIEIAMIEEDQEPLPTSIAMCPVKNSPLQHRV